jgi:hypothetical protein
MSSFYKHDVINLSDHEPLNSIINYIVNENPQVQVNNIINENIIKLNPNLENDEINLKFNNILNQQMEEQIKNLSENVSICNKQIMVDDMYKQLTSSIIFAFDACSRITTRDKIKEKRWFTRELKIIKQKLLLYRFGSELNENNRNEYKKLKLEFKKTMKKNIYLYEKKEYFKIEKLNNLFKIKLKFKETIISFLENKQHCFAVFLDAIKVFDNIWRSGLYVKMKRGKILLSYIILLRIYYDNLARGIKQGGVMSGALFNYYINDLIEECFQSGVGAKFIEIWVANIVFCEDICLLSHNKEDMQI